MKEWKGIRLPGKDDVTEPGELIAAGHQASVYAWGDDRVIKLYSGDDAADEATREYYNALAVRKYGLPMPKMYELKTVSGGTGIICERLNGETLEDYLLRTRDTKGSAEIMVRLQRQINGIKGAGGVETGHAQLRRRMLSNEKADTPATSEMIRMLGTMRDGDVLCHGNIHPSEIILTEEGPKVVDCSSISTGDRLFDIAKTFYLIAHRALYEESEHKEEYMEMKKELTGHYLIGMGTDATMIGAYLSMIIAAEAGRSIDGRRKRPCC